RDRVGTDVTLPEPGVLIWQIDADQLDATWFRNNVNTDPNRMGVWLRQADGENDLGRPGRGRGDGADPFPGETGATAFHAGTTPASFTHNGTASGVTITDIQIVGAQARLNLLARYQTVTLRSQGTSGGGPMFTVDGARASSATYQFPSAPFQTHQVAADGGEETADGFRNGFVRWTDGVTERVRTFTTGTTDAELVAEYGNPEVRLDIALQSPVPGITPATIVTDPPSEEGWVRLGTDVLVTAQPRTGFAFVRWTGALEGQPNPATVRLDQPMSAGAEFEQTFGVADPPGEVQLEAAAVAVIEFEVVNGNDPIEWALLDGKLPAGMIFQSSQGAIRGAPLQDGDFPVVVRATDGIGLHADTPLTLRVTPPTLGLQAMASPFLQSGDLDLNVRLYLDLKGNANGRYDLGDFRAYVLANPGAPLETRTLEAAPTTIRVPLVVRKEEEVR
ncbi:MAG: hypothetical protein D6701_13245, partial [Gemmatimonadetes bacterium]